MSTTILLTGATGFIGTQVLRHLADKPVRVRLVLRPGQEIPGNGYGVVEDVVETPDLFTERDEWYRQACEGIDTIFHLAWYVEAGKYLTSDKNIDCLQGSLALAKAGVECGVKRVVGAGTCFEYDTSGGRLSTDTPLRPESLYAATKASLYEVLTHYLQAHDVGFQWCRFFFLFGEGESPNRLVPYLRSRLERGEKAELTSGTQVRDFLDVSDAAVQFVEAGLGSGTGPVNICSGEAITVRQLAESIADEYGRRDLLAFGTRQENYTDPPCVVGIR